MLTRTGMPGSKRLWYLAITLGASLSVIGCGGPAVSHAIGSHASAANSNATPSSATPAYVAAGAQPDAGQDQWVLGTSTLAITRDGGSVWTELPLPPAASDIATVAVLPTETIAVTDSSASVSVEIDTLPTGQTAWQSSTVAAGVTVGSAQIVDLNGALSGVMITEESSAQFSQGMWLGTTDGGATWQMDPTPVGGVVTDAGGLWLVGGVVNSDVYFSSDGGATWQSANLPAAIAGPLAFGPVQVNGTGIVTVANNTEQLQVVTGVASATGWQWTDGPVLSLGGQYGAGATADTSVAAGVLWVVSPNNNIGLVTLATGSVSHVSAHGLPSNGLLQISATSGQSATATYSTAECPTGSKANCSSVAGVLTSSNGGQDWSPQPSSVAN